jgi:hypothetical protein
VAVAQALYSRKPVADLLVAEKTAEHSTIVDEAAFAYYRDFDIRHVLHAECRLLWSRCCVEVLHGRAHCHDHLHLLSLLWNHFHVLGLAILALFLLLSY